MRRAIAIDGRRRRFWVALAASEDAPLLVVLHGLRGTGKSAATVTKLATRAPAAGVTAVFPDGLRKMWDEGPDSPVRRRRGDADVRFIQGLIDLLVADKPNHGALFLAGMSNGAAFAEHLARHGHLRVGGLALITGSATRASRDAMPTPAQAAKLISFAGTGDPLVPYDGGPRRARGLLGRFITYRAGRTSHDAAADVVGAEQVARDWATANQDRPQPTVEALGGPAPGDLPVARLVWSAPSRPSVTLYRIEGGGHVWPGTRQYFPARFIGRASPHLDATEIILKAVCSQDA